MQSLVLFTFVHYKMYVCLVDICIIITAGILSLFANQEHVGTQIRWWRLISILSSLQVNMDPYYMLLETEFENSISQLRIVLYSLLDRCIQKGVAGSFNWFVHLHIQVLIYLIYLWITRARLLWWWCIQTTTERP